MHALKVLHQCVGRRCGFVWYWIPWLGGGLHYLLEEIDAEDAQGILGGYAGLVVGESKLNAEGLDGLSLGSIGGLERMCHRVHGHTLA